MPEPNFLFLSSYTSEPPKKAPIIKLSCGIGDTDGFPAFDVDSDQYAAKDDSKWGFLITGGAEFHMPLTVFQVTPDGLADKGGICLGDILLEINEEDATQLTLSQANEKIDASGKKVHFLVKSMDDEDLLDGHEPGEERSIVLRVPKPPPPPKVSTIEKRLQELQRKLSEISEIPKILSSTLATVSQTFDKLTTTLPPSVQPTHCRHHHFQSGNDYCPDLYGIEQKRKLSYDEDVYDYELSDETEAADDNDAHNKEFDAKEAYLQLKRYAAKQKKSRDVTPESDYASESNYQQNITRSIKQRDMTSDNDDDDNIIDDDDDNYKKNAAVTSFHDGEEDYGSDDNDDDGERSCDMYEEFNLSMLKMPSGHANDESDVEDYDDDANDKDKDCDDDKDFLTTTFTWNLRNKSKLQKNDGDDYENANKECKDNSDDDSEDKLNVSPDKPLNKANDIFSLESHTKNNTTEKEQKMDKLERSWPWADREKIIYKQSTCHLVPHKPLGLIEKRIQLLAKRNLLEHINKSNPRA